MTLMEKVEQQLGAAFRKACGRSDLLTVERRHDASENQDVVICGAAWKQPANPQYAAPQFEGQRMYALCSITEREAKFVGEPGLPALVEDKIADMKEGARLVGFRLKSGAWEKKRRAA